MSKKQIIIFFVVLTVVALVLLRHNDRANGSSVKIGAIIALTGDAARAGEMERKGIELAVEELNSRGGVDGKRFILLTDDFGLDTTRAVSLFHRFVEVEKVDVVIGPTWSDASIAVAPLADRAKVITITPSTSLLPEKREHIFSMWPSDVDAARTIANRIYQDGVKRLAILSIQNLWSENLSKNVSTTFRELGGEVVYSGVIKDLDVRSEIVKMKQKNPEAVYLAVNVSELSLYLKQAKELGFQQQVYGADSIEDPELLKLVGGLVEGIVYPWPNEARSVVFVQKFQNKYGEEPAMSAEEAYDAVMIAAEGLKRCQKKVGNADLRSLQSECIRNEIASLKEYYGASGVFSMRSDGFPEKEFMVKTINGGRFVVKDE